MANLIEEAKTRIDALLRDACRRAAAEGLFPEDAELRGTVEIPKDARNGDYAANHAMAGAKAMKMPPRKIAEILTQHLELEGSWFDSAEIAGPGFLNFRVSDKWYADVLAAVEAEGPAYGRAGSRTGEKVMVEFVSANPTGPMTIGNARGGVLGDTLATVLDMAGADVYREFYVNDAGNQVDKFGRSIDERYRELLSGDGDVRANLQRILDLRAADSDWEGFPEDAYHGLDIVDLAMEIIERDGDKYLALDEEARKQAFISYGEQPA